MHQKTHLVSITTQLSTDVLERLERLAHTQQVARAFLIRTLIDEALAQRDAQDQHEVSHD